MATYYSNKCCCTQQPPPQNTENCCPYTKKTATIERQLVQNASFTISGCLSFTVQYISGDVTFMGAPLLTSENYSPIIDPNSNDFIVPNGTYSGDATNGVALIVKYY